MTAPARPDADMLNSVLSDAGDAFTGTGHPLAKHVGGILKSLDAGKCTGKPSFSPVLRWLAPALAAPDCRHAARALDGSGAGLAWVEAVRGRQAHQPALYCFAMIAGPGGMIEDDRLRFGVYLQRPGTAYLSHRHEAEELYLPLSGVALWQKDNADFAPVASGTLIHHAPWQPHATATQDAPLLALWAWTGNLDFETYSFVAG